MRIVTLLLLCGITTLAQAECRLSLPRAGFADAIDKREPVGDGSGASGRVWFFTEVADGAGEILYHQWYRNGVEDIRIRLPVRTDRWRTWSARHTDPASRITVRVLTESGCDLGEYGLGADRTDGDVLATARAALAQGDLTGARLLARQAQESGNRSNALNRFIDEELALAELERDIAADNLYVAGGRIDNLQRRPLSPQQHDALAKLKARHSARSAGLQQEMNIRLMALQRSLANLPPATACNAEIQGTDWLPEPERDRLLITGQQHSNKMQVIELLDQRTGAHHQLERPCL
jgi:hypothetical protein